MTSYSWICPFEFPVHELTPVEGTHTLGYTGMCRGNGLVFHKKSLDMGPIFV